MATVQGNANQIQVNRKKIFDLEHTVLRNRAKAVALRAAVTENNLRIGANYQAAFSGNRQLANANTDDVFRNRLAIVRNIDARTPVEVNYKEALLNRTKLEFLAHRAKMNERVLNNSQALANANRQLIDINRSIMDGNEEVVQFNAKIIASNTALLNGGIDTRGATKESNADLIAANAKTIKEIQERAASNAKKIQDLQESVDRNRVSITANREAIHNRRERMLANQATISKNQAKVGEFVLAKL